MAFFISSQATHYSRGSTQATTGQELDQVSQHATPDKWADFSKA